MIFWPVLKDKVDDRQQKRILSTFISWSEFKILYALHPKTLSFPYCHHTPFFCARHRLHGIFPVFTMAQEYHKQLPFSFHVFPMKSFCIISHLNNESIYSIFISHHIMMNARLLSNLGQDPGYIRHTSSAATVQRLHTFKKYTLSRRN